MFRIFGYEELIFEGLGVGWIFCRLKFCQGDAIINLPSDGNVFYFYNPFSAEKVREFEQQISSIYHDKEIRIIYYNPKSIHVFNNNNWDIVKINFENDCGVKRWGRINKYHDLAIVTRRKWLTIIPPSK